MLEIGGDALAVLASGKGKVTAIKATSEHDNIAQRWVGHAEVVGSDQFRFSSGKDGRYLKANGNLVAPDGTATVGDLFTVHYKAGKGYVLQNKAGEYVNVLHGLVLMSSSPKHFSIFSVTYDY